MFPMSQTIYLHLVKFYSQVGKQTHKKVFISLSKQINYNKNTQQSVFVQQLTVTEQTFYKMPLFYILLLISSHSFCLPSVQLCCPPGQVRGQDKEWQHPRCRAGEDSQVGEEGVLGIQFSCHRLGWCANNQQN